MRIETRILEGENPAETAGLHAQQRRDANLSGQAVKAAASVLGRHQFRYGCGAPGEDRQVTVVADRRMKYRASGFGVL